LEKILASFAPYPLRPPVVLDSLSSKFDPVSRFPKICVDVDVDRVYKENNDKQLIAIN
jgi:hypothetical protein